jgi:hypothetical protein
MNRQNDGSADHFSPTEKFKERNIPEENDLLNIF